MLSLLLHTTLLALTPLDSQNIVNRFFKPLLRRAGLPDIRWHDLRHADATLLLAEGKERSRSDDT
jgi:site-specific recombinase XerD